MTNAVFQHLTVIELAQGVSGPYAAMQLGDFGARVIKIEPPEGDWSRAMGPPFVQGESALYLGLNRNKESLALDYTQPEGREQLRALVQIADVLIIDLLPVERQTLRLDYADLAPLNPRLIYCAITPFGEAGPMANQPGSELILQAVSGYTRYVGEPGGEPVRLGADMAGVNTGAFAYQAIVAALIARQQSGVGQATYVSQLGALLATKTIMLGAQHSPDDWDGFHLVASTDGPEHGWKTQDGYITCDFGASWEAWAAFCERIGLGHLIDDPRFEDWYRTMCLGAEAQLLRHEYEKGFADKTSQELIDLIRELGGNAFPYLDYDHLLRTEQVESLSVLVDAPLPEGGALRVVGCPWQSSALKPDIRTAPPRLGAHTEAILAELKCLDTPRQTQRDHPLPDGGVMPGPGPLAGLKVVDVTSAAAGPFVASLLGQLGAEVIKIEAPSGDRIHNVLPTQNGRCTTYLSMNVNKKGVILDLKDPDAYAVALDLIDACDIFLENFRRGVPERLGLSYDTLSARNPRLIYCTVAGWGDGGPWAQLANIDPYVQAASGFTSLNGKPDSDGESLRYYGHLDLTTACIAVQAVLTALYARQQSGAGQHVQTSLMAASLALQATRIAEYHASGRQPPRLGHAVSYHAPHQAFVTQSHWIAVAAHTEAQWRSLRLTLDLSEYAEDARFTSNARRVAHRDALAAILQARFRQKPALWWLHTLRRHGVPCGVFMGYPALRHHQQVAANALMVELDTPYGPFVVSGLPWRFSRTPCQLQAPSDPGQYTQAVIRSTGRDPAAIAGAMDDRPKFVDAASLSSQPF